jgi:hypothetical protein
VLSRDIYDNLREYILEGRVNLVSVLVMENSKGSSDLFDPGSCHERLMQVFVWKKILVYSRKTFINDRQGNRCLAEIAPVEV